LYDCTVHTHDKKFNEKAKELDEMCALQTHSPGGSTSTVSGKALSVPVFARAPVTSTCDVKSHLKFHLKFRFSWGTGTARQRTRDGRTDGQTDNGDEQQREVTWVRQDDHTDRSHVIRQSKRRVCACVVQNSTARWSDHLSQ